MDELAYDAAKLVPGLTPTRKQVEAESELMQSEKDGVEVDQGIFLAHVLADAKQRHASLPRHAAAEGGSDRAHGRFHQDRRDRFRPGAARAQRQDRDRDHPESALPQRRRRRHAGRHRDRGRHGDLRSDERNLRAARRRGRASEIQRPPRVLQPASISRISIAARFRYLWYIRRDMGVVNKMLRGLAMGARSPDEIYGGTHEKPWVAQRRCLRHRRRLPVSAGDGLRGGRQRRLHDAAGAQGGHHPGRRQFALPAFRRPAHRAPGDHDGQAARLRLAGRPHGLRHGRAAGRGRAGGR